MTAKEKAKELVDKFKLQMPVQIITIASKKVNQLSCDIDLKSNIKNAKQCALIAVDEIIDISYWAFMESGGKQEQEFWQEVKQEIEAL